jgi:hypothetical protein
MFFSCKGSGKSIEVMEPAYVHKRQLWKLLVQVYSDRFLPIAIQVLSKHIQLKQANFSSDEMRRNSLVRRS